MTSNGAGRPRGRVKKFTEIIADPNPLHADEAVAKKSRYGRLLAPPAFPGLKLQNPLG